MMLGSVLLCFQVCGVVLQMLGERSANMLFGWISQAAAFAVRSMCLQLPEQHVHHPATPHMRTRAATMVEYVWIFAPGLLQCVG